MISVKDLRIGNWVQSNGRKFQCTLENISDFESGNIKLESIQYHEDFLKIWDYESIQELATDLIEQSIPSLVDHVSGISAQIASIPIHEIQNTFHSLTGKEL